MSKFRFNITMTLDGYVAGPNQSVETPLGGGGSPHPRLGFEPYGLREIHGGARLFDNLGPSSPQLEQLRTIAGPGVTHLTYHVVK